MGSTESAISVSGETDATNLSNGLSSLSLESISESEIRSSSNQVIDDIEALSIEDKTTRLLELFPSEKASEVAYTLRKSDGDFTRAMDSLLNHVFFNNTDVPGEDRVPTRGIDAFAAEHVASRGKIKKGKNRKYKSMEEHSTASTRTMTEANKWETANSDILFIASRTNISDSTVSSIYHKNGASKQKTILALIGQNSNSEHRSTAGNRSVDIDANTLLKAFPSLSFSQAAALIRLTQPSTASAHELAKSLTTSTSSPEELGRIVPQYVPIKICDVSPDPRPPSRDTLVDGSSATFASARHDAFTKASAYYRRGKSDHLMGGAAAYYASLGRDANLAMKKAAAAEADALVTSQSSPTQLDLHGVSVKDATRIASERVRAWWHDLGEGRISSGGRRGLGGGYHIVTGLGRHSDGGVAKLGPAVAKTLLREGWKIEVGSGVLTVVGVAQRR